MPRLKAVTTTAFDALQSYIGSTSAPSEALAHARDHAQEYSLPLPDESLGQLISTLAAASTGHAATPKAQAIVISPAAAVVDLPVDLDQPVLDELRGLHPVLHQVGELQELAQADHAVADGDLFNIAHRCNDA